MSFFKKSVFIGIGIFVPLIVCCVILELIFGAWLFEDKWRQTREINIIRNVKIDYDVKNIYGNKMPVVHYSRDKNGLRGGCKDPSNIDILTLGGSTTDQRYIGDGGTYQDELQKLLSEYSDKNVCVSNAGVDGHSTYGHLAAFKYWLPLIDGLKPRYFLLYVGINDAGFRFTPNAGADVAMGSAFSSIICQKSALYALIKNLHNILISYTSQRAYAGHSVLSPADVDYVAFKLTNGAESQIRHNTEEFKKRFTLILDQMNEIGGTPICVSQPHQYARDIQGTKRGVKNVFEYQGVNYSGLDYDASIYSLNQEMKTLCIENNGYFIDVYAMNFDKSDFYDGVHMTPKGAKRLGGYLFKEFLEQEIPIK